VLDQYFSCLKSREYEKANQLVVQADENIIFSIEASAVNDLIFKDIKYEIWKIYSKDKYLVAETVVTQISLKSAYIDTVKEYAEYVEEAKNQNKIFTEQALKEKWDEIFYKHVASVKEKSVFKCDIYINVEDKNSPQILMTADFRNCLFGGELDAINMLNQMK